MLDLSVTSMISRRVSSRPPLKPEFLPRPYGWEVFNRESDPNNPYNLIDAAPLPRAEGDRATGRPRPPTVSICRRPSLLKILCRNAATTLGEPAYI